MDPFNLDEDTSSDAQLAFLLQQEEYGAIQIQHIVVPHNTGYVPHVEPSPIAKKKEGPSIIVLDDSEEEPIAPQPRKLELKEKEPEEEDDALGLLDVHKLFIKYNDLYFEGRLDAVSVEWSQKMTLCAGLCTWKRTGECRIKLSSKLLQYRTNKELKETLLHECIHAYLFVTHNHKDRDGHGPEFLKKMNFINSAGGFNISIYHSFHDEVNHFRTHWWQCDKCKYIIKRAMNRAPGPSDWWYPKHEATCGGNYIKIKSPPESENKKKRKREQSLDPPESGELAKKKPASLPPTPSVPSKQSKLLTSWLSSSSSSPSKPSQPEQSSKSPD